MSQTRFELKAQLATIEVSADQHQRILSGSVPPALVEGKPLSDEMKDVSRVAFGHPQDALAAKYAVGKIPIEESLKSVHCQRLI